MWRYGRPRKQTVELPTIWEVPDDLWAVVEAAIGELDPPRRGGRPRIDQRAAFNAVIHRLRSGCQGNRLPLGSPTTAPCTAPSSAGSPSWWPAACSRTGASSAIEIVSKAGLNRFTISLADETREHGIVAFTLSPGGFGADNAMQEYLRTVDVPEWRRWRDARQRGGPDQSGGSDRTARQVAQLASGMLDALSGRIITYSDDLDDLARRADEIVRENRNTVQYVK